MVFAFLLGVLLAIAAATAVGLSAVVRRRRRPREDGDGQPVFAAMLFAGFLALIVGWILGAWVSTLVVVGPLGLGLLAVAIVVGVVAVALAERAWRGSRKS